MCSKVMFFSECGDLCVLSRQALFRVEFLNSLVALYMCNSCFVWYLMCRVVGVNLSSDSLSGYKCGNV